MWVRILDSGQELDMFEGPALRFIAGGHAVRIDPPTEGGDRSDPIGSGSSECKAIGRIQDPQLKEAVSAVYAAGLPASAAAIVLRLLKLEARIAELEQRLETRIAKLEQRLSAEEVAQP